MKKALFILLIFVWAIPQSFGQLKTYSFEEVENKIKEHPKPVVVFTHTSWCKYCRMMENSTFRNEEVVAMRNRDFYFISFDAESKEKITFNNHVFRFSPTGQNTGIHELAIELATIKGEIAYPTITILAADYSILLQASSYKDAKTLLSLLKSVLHRP